MKVVTVVGARPQFIKAAAVSHKLRQLHTEVLVHTGQHYDYLMSGVFFDGLDIPTPDFNLEVGSGPHGMQTGEMLQKIEAILHAERPDWLLVYGDTNSTLAGALAAAKMKIRVAHVEAGLRSFNREMPEEVNRVITDHLSDLLLCPSETAIDNLAREGITGIAHKVGDVMRDLLEWAKPGAIEAQPTVLNRLGLEKKGYILVTVHRSENTDDLDRLSPILQALDYLHEPVIFPAHPRTRKAMIESGYYPGQHIRVIEPCGYLEMIALTEAARLILTDSGGLQKEAYWLKVPCVTLRDETEWTETVAAGWNVIVGANTGRIVDAAMSFAPNGAHPELYGTGSAADQCVRFLEVTTHEKAPSEELEGGWRRKHDGIRV